MHGSAGFTVDASVGRLLAADRRHKTKTVAPKGQGAAVDVALDVGLTALR
jgi:hypothetical protein